MMDNNYILIVAHTTCELEHKVNERLDTYEPLGGPVAFGVGLVQAIVKRPYAAAVDEIAKEMVRKVEYNVN
jgi:hypothetical protein